MLYNKVCALVNIKSDFSEINFTYVVAYNVVNKNIHMAQIIGVFEFDVSIKTTL